MSARPQAAPAPTPTPAPTATLTLAEPASGDRPTPAQAPAPMREPSPRPAAADGPALAGPSRWPARLAAALIVGFARAVTGVRARWLAAPVVDQPTVYFANHSSHGDFVLLWAALPPQLRRHTRPVAAADYWDGSALRRFIGGQVFRALLIDRERQTQAPDPVQAMAAALAAGQSLILFPEGTRNTSDQPLLALRSGLYHLAQACPQARLVPVWISNLKRVLPKGSWVPVPLACSVSLGEALVLQPGEPRAAFLARARDALLALRPDADGQ